MPGRYPYTIDNGLGEKLTFTRVTQGPDGLRVEAEGIAQPGAGPPMHVHHLQEEAVRVVRGRLGHQVDGGAAEYAEPGDVVVWPPGTAHRWWNAGTEELHTTGWCSPPHNIEFFLGALFASTRDNGGRPSLFDIAFLTARYRGEFGLVGVPVLLRRLVLPLLYVIGRLLGKHRKYRDAPPPVPAGPT
jgi:quercetin dioxygenase-like cupin family protein